MKRSCFHEVKVDWLPVWTHFRFPTKNIGLDGLEYALTTKKVKRKSLELFGHYVTTFLFIRYIGTLSGNRIRK